MKKPPRRATRVSRALLAWYDRHGRTNLPWKSARDPYHVWVSEIMLQQTQVATVIPYFERFIKRFPTVIKLARADLNAVLHQWAGLGYYARARNLHRTARILAREHRGVFPRALDVARSLPGIGRSTAGAILALAYNERQAILDGNVKRVLARYHAIDAPVTSSATDKLLWELAESHTPQTRVAEYTQAIMDLGATVCRRVDPLCARCPLTRGCAAYHAGNPGDYPVPRVRRAVPVRRARLLLIHDARGRVLLQRRPPVGVWGGLYSLPECASADVRTWCRAELGLDVAPQAEWPTLRHRFSHFRLDITPIPARLRGAAARVMEHGDTVWYNGTRERGLPAPIKNLVKQLRND